MAFHLSDEAEADVQLRIEAIQQNEIDQIRELGLLLDNELSYAEQYAQILRDVKDNWPGKSVLPSFHSCLALTDKLRRQQIAKLMEPRRPIGPMHHFSHDRAESPKPKIRSRTSSKSRAQSRSSSPGGSDSEINDKSPQPRSRKSSVHSRAGSVYSRKRSDSQTTTGSATSVAREKKEKEEKKKGSWSVWSRNGSKKDREQFTSLRSGDDDSDSSDPERTPGSPTQVLKNASLLSLGKWTKSQQSNTAPRIPALGAKTRGRESDRQNFVRAVSDYLGSSDELSFRVGDEIVVIGEVIDGWMMGQLDGKKGLFPTVYTEPIAATSGRAVSKPPVAPAPPLLQRKSSSKGGSDTATDSRSGSRQTLVDTNLHTSPRLGLRAPPALETDTEGDDDDKSHPFGDHHATTQDTDHEQGPRASAALRSGSGYSYDSESLAESAADESEHEQSNLVRRRASDDGFVNHWDKGNPASTSSSSLPKKVPPPLPRRQTDVRKAPPPPPPPRWPDIRASPQPPTYALKDGQTGDCVNFVQAMGRTTGMCTNCQRMHIQ
jgi:SWI/SNF-related matrix-associated actin-dependent regulator of chromatin subfamily D